MTIVDLSIVNVALPTIGRSLHFSESNLQWVVTAYGLTFGGFLLLGGRAADLLGRRLIFMIGLAVFPAASLGGALDRDEHLPRGRRAQQGARPVGRGRCERRDGGRAGGRVADAVRRVGVH